MWKFIIDREIEAPARFQAIQSYRCAISISGLQFLVSPLWLCSPHFSIATSCITLCLCSRHRTMQVRRAYTGLHHFLLVQLANLLIRYVLNMQLCKDMYMWLSQPPSCYHSCRISPVKSWLFALSRMIPSTLQSCMGAIATLTHHTSLATA